MKIGVIGAGAAGMMCVATLIEKWFDGEIFLFDKNLVLGKKVAITGGGRCNLTTGLRDRKKLLSKYIRGADFVSYALGKFSPLAVWKRFEAHGVALKMEEDLRVFPQSNKSAEVIWVFEKIFSGYKNLFLELGTGVVDVLKNGDGFDILTEKWTFFCDKVVVATGGSAYQKTWSSGDAYAWGQNFWHRITDLAPSLSSFEVEEWWIKSLSGTAFSRAQIFIDGKVFSWPLLFTHWGISGPLVFEVSAFLAYRKIDLDAPCKVFLQFDAERRYDFWEQLLIENQQKYADKMIKNILHEFFSKKFIDVFLEHFFSHLLDSKIGVLKKEDRKKISHLLWGKLEIDLIWRKPWEEFVTVGGLSSDEISSETMESKLIKWLYFVGEVLDVDAVTGGFNLQACWAMGMVSALAMLS